MFEQCKKVQFCRHKASALPFLWFSHFSLALSVCFLTSLHLRCPLITIGSFSKRSTKHGVPVQASPRAESGSFITRGTADTERWFIFWNHQKRCEESQPPVCAGCTLCWIDLYCWCWTLHIFFHQTAQWSVRGQTCFLMMAQGFPLVSSHRWLILAFFFGTTDFYIWK